MLTRCLAFVSSIAFLSGCAVTPVPNRTCAFKLVPFDVGLPELIGVPTLEEVIADAYSRSSSPPDFLFMSGGSEHGSFGAGVLSAWGAKHGRLPDFELVTGVSTGAILASPAFAGDHHYAALEYSDIWERQLLKAYAKKRNGDITLGSAPSVLRHGAVASLEPMREVLKQYLVGQRGFEKIAARAQSGKLLVGAVDVDSGKMVAFDMTDMAARVINARTADERALLSDCYYDAIIASAAAPLAATPVFIDNRMYADGGMRYSLFGERVMEILAELKRARSIAPPNMYLILNGTGETEVWCRGDVPGSDSCDTLANPNLPATAAPKKWDLIDLGMRSVDILSNQVSRFSIDYVDSKNKLLFGPNTTNLRFLRIEVRNNPRRIRPGADHIFPRLPDPNGKSCKAWREGDEARDHPLQFHHDYMACMVDYGKWRAENDPEW